MVLSGEGADELFGGYLTYRADRIATWLRLIPAPLRRLMVGALGLWPVSNDKISLEYKVKRLMRGSLLTADEAHCYWNGTFSSAEQTALGRPASRISDLYQVGQGADLRGLSRSLWFDQQYFLTDDILMKSDRMSMAHALELRPAFLDHRIVEFAASLPDHLKIHGSNQKYVLRELMRGKLPDSVLDRKKEGFDIPAHAWLRGRSALSAARHVESRCYFALSPVLAGSRAADHRRPSGTSRKFWLSSMGPDDTLFMDETLECLR